MPMRRPDPGGTQCTSHSRPDGGMTVARKETEMKRLATVLLFTAACAAERAAPPVPPPAPLPAATREASLGCAACKTFEVCNAQPGCMWAGLPLGGIKRVE